MGSVLLGVRMISDLGGECGKQGCMYHRCFLLDASLSTEGPLEVLGRAKKVNRRCRVEDLGGLLLIQQLQQAVRWRMWNAF